MKGLNQSCCRAHMGTILPRLLLCHVADIGPFTAALLLVASAAAASDSSAPAPAAVQLSPVSYSGAAASAPRDVALTLDAFVGALEFDVRYGGLFVGAQLGGTFLGRVRLVLRAASPTMQVRDDASSWVGPGDEIPPGTYWNVLPKRDVSLAYGANLGVFVYRGESFGFAPGLTAWRADVADYGTVLALELPFEWTLRGGTRLGFSLGKGIGYGGTYAARCEGGPESGANACAPGTTETQSRGAQSTWHALLFLGWDFDRGATSLREVK